MSNIKDFLLETAYEYLRYHPCYTLDECISYIQNTNDINYWLGYRDTMRLRKATTMELVFSFEKPLLVSVFLSNFREKVDRQTTLQFLFENSYIFLEQKDLDIHFHIDLTHCTGHPVRISFPKTTGLLLDDISK